MTEKRHAMAAAVAASAVTSLVQARGHRVEKVPELPLVVSAGAESVKKTRVAVEMLKQLGCADDLKRVVDSKTLRPGKGKARNRRYIMRKGPLVVFSENDGLAKAVRNIPGVDSCHVDRLNLLQVAPGGYAGRLIVWTAPAVERLNALFGSYTEMSELKNNYRMIRPEMANSDLSRIINSEEIQSVLNPKMEAPKVFKRIGNPLKRTNLREKLSPGYASARMTEIIKRTPGSELNELFKKKRAERNMKRLKVLVAGLKAKKAAKKAAASAQ